MQTDRRSWRVPPAQTAVKAVAAAVFAGPAVLGGDRSLALLAGIAAAGMAVLALRDVLAPVRLAADAEGVTVIAGFAGRRLLPWAAVTEIKLDETRRFGLRVRLLEIATPDGPHLLSRYDLGADPADVRTELTELRTRDSQGPIPHEPGTESSHEAPCRD